MNVRQIRRFALGAASVLALGVAPVLLTSCTKQRLSTFDDRMEQDSAVLAQRLDGLRSRAADGDSNAQLELAARHYEGLGVEQDRSLAAHWYMLAAQAGEAHGQFSMGILYENGDGVPESIEKAVRWYELAAEQNHVRALTNLGLLLASGSRVPRDGVRARELLDKAASRGNADAQFGLGSLHVEGIGGPVDQKRGVQWIRQSAEQGNIPAMRAFSAALGRGLGVRADRGLALAWLERAADAGDAQSAFELAIDLLKNDEPASDAAAIVRLFEAAEGGLPEAMHNLGLLSLRGRAVSQNRSQAREWFKQAAALDFAPSKEALAKLAN